MVQPTIPQMNRRLQELSQIFISSSKEFTHKLSLHEGRFNTTDFNDFQQLLQEIKNQGLQRIRKFFQQRFQTRSQVYQSQIRNYIQQGNNTTNQLNDFRETLTTLTIETKKQQNRKQNLMQHFSEKMRKNLIMRKIFKIWKDHNNTKKKQRYQQMRMDQVYKSNLLKKAFYPWRMQIYQIYRLTYKDGYANTVSKQAGKDIQHIQAQYQGIIDILKQKIKQTDQIIKVKKSAKGQFAYALSKNLLKTISNLSLQVMNLNQMSLRDGQWSQQSTNRFMNQVDQVIKQKLTQVRQYRQGLVQQQIQQQGQRKRKHISFA